MRHVSDEGANEPAQRDEGASESAQRDEGASGPVRADQEAREPAQGEDVAPGAAPRGSFGAARLAWWRRRPSATVSRWVIGPLGLICTVIGLVILVRPLMSLDTLVLSIAVGMIASGLADLAPIVLPSGSTSRGVRTIDVAAGLGWVALGLVVAVWPGLSLGALVLLTGIALAVAGVARVIHAIRAQQPGGERAASVLLGVASLVVGVLALTWPDITVLVIAVTFGARTLWFGLVHLWAALGPRRRGVDGPTIASAGAASSPPSPPQGRDGSVAPASPSPPDGLTSPSPPERSAPSSHRRRTRRTRRPSLVAAIIAMVAALLAAGLSAWINAGRPVVDAFYASPDTLPTGPGQLIRSEPFSRDVPSGAIGWRILYTTTDSAGAARTASALVVVPDDPAPHPVVAWTHGTTGYAPACAPSLAAEPFESGALFVLDKVIGRGWALVATDYAGMGTASPQPYLIGEGEARSELDAVRAARHLSGASLSDKTVVWGHSQGGHAALWTGQLAAEYAPDVPLRGVAALAPASDLTAFAGELNSITGGSVFASYVIAAFSQTYPDVSFDRYVRPAARVLVRQMATRCLAEPGILVSVLSALSLAKDPVIWSQDPVSGPLGARLAANVPTGRIPAPVLIAQGQADTLILPAMQRQYVQGRCSAGQQLDYRTYPGRDHVSLVQPDSPLIADLLSWTADRFAGKPAPDDCGDLPG